MSIQSEMERITQNISNTYSALEEQGATMPAEQNSDNLAATARSVPAGGGGTVSWNDLTDKPFYATDVVIFPETTVTFEEQEALDGMNAFIAECSFVLQQEATYKVRFDGVDYICRCTLNGNLGNEGALVEGIEPTNEPFIIMVMEGLLVILPLTEVESATVEIYKEEVRPIANKYLVHSDVLDLIDMGFPTVPTDNAVIDDDGVGILATTDAYLKVVDNLNRGGIWVRLNVSGRWSVGVCGSTSGSNADIEDRELLLFFNMTNVYAAYNYKKFQCTAYYHGYWFVMSIDDVHLKIRSFAMNMKEIKN